MLNHYSVQVLRRHYSALAPESSSLTARTICRSVARLFSNEAIVQFCTIGGYAGEWLQSTEGVRQRWSEVVNEVACDKTRVIVEKNGVPVAGMVSPQDLE